MNDEIEKQIKRAFLKEFLIKEFPLLSEKDIEDIIKMKDLIQRCHEFDKEKVKNEN